MLQLTGDESALIGIMSLPGMLLFAAKKSTKKSTLGWLIHLGGPGLILLGLADNSLIPLPGSTDVATILLAAHHRQPWFYYSFMATVGAVVGGYLTYRMARKGGKETLEKKFSQKRVKKLYAIFERWGFADAAGGGSHAVSDKEVLGGIDGGARRAVHDSGVFGRALWAEYPEVLRGILLAGADRINCVFGVGRTVRAV